MSRKIVVGMIACAFFGNAFITWGSGFMDDFSGDLSNWNAYGSGTWAINGADQLTAYYNTDCGSVYCAQSDLIVSDEFQVDEDYRASVDFIRVQNIDYPTLYSAVGAFSVWGNANQKFQIVIGGSGWGSWGGATQTNVTVGVQIWDGRWNNPASLSLSVPYVWNPNEWHTASIEKSGTQYSMYLDDILLAQYTDDFMNGEGKAGLHIYGYAILDNYSLEPIIDPIDISSILATSAINLRSKGRTPLTVITTDDFDATSIDPSTVLFAMVAPVNYAFEDVDEDGDIDLTMLFNTQDLEIGPSDTEAVLIGQTYSGEPVMGLISIKMVP